MRVGGCCVGLKFCLGIDDGEGSESHFVEDGRGAFGDELHGPIAKIELAKGVSEDDGVDIADTGLGGEDAFGEGNFEGPAANAGGDGDAGGEIRGVIVALGAEHKGVVGAGEFSAGGGAEVHMDEVAALRGVGQTSHEIPRWM